MMRENKMWEHARQSEMSSERHVQKWHDSLKKLMWVEKNPIRIKVFLKMQ